MKKARSNYSGSGLTGRTVVLGLSALLLAPVGAHAENAEAKVLATQVVQQSRTVKGHIVDETGEPMIGVSVKVKGSKTATVTDLDGNFAISAAPGDLLEVTYIGYKTQTVKATASSLSLPPS